MTVRSRFGHGLLLLSLLSVLALTVGCGGAATEPVSGKLSANGQPVTGGTLSFAPVGDGSVAAAQPSDAKVNADGTFTVTNGAVAGKNRVSYYPPPVEIGEPVEWDGKGKPPETPKSEFDGMKVDPAEVEVKAGGTELELTLVPATGT